MSLGGRVLELARIETGAATPDERARIRAFDRLNAMLGVLDSKTSVLLRFNAIVVAALAFIVVVRTPDPFAALNATARLAIQVIAHLSLATSIVSCGFAFPVIAVQRGGPVTADDAGLDRLGAVTTRRTLLYAWAWRFAVASGLGFAAIIVIDIFN
jgi:hypothetical protein